MKISVLVADFSTNCLGRAYILARILSRRYQVEVIGPLFGSHIWPPADTGEIPYFPISVVPGHYRTHTLPQMLEAISGQVIYALKPLNTSYAVALIAQMRRHIPVVLDIDDWEVGAVRWNLKQNYKSLITELPSPHWYGWTLLLDKLTWRADKITVSNRFLAQKYGGYLLPHGQDTNFLDPNKYEAAAIRKDMGLPTKKCFCLWVRLAPIKDWNTYFMRSIS